MSFEHEPPGGEPLAVRTTGLTKRFGRVTALDGVDLRVPEGAVYVLAGANGAGKTTLFRLLLNLVRSDGGRSEVLGLDCRADGPRARAQIGYVPERFAWMDPNLPVGRALSRHAAYFVTWDAAYAEALVRRYRIETLRTLGELSKGGMRRVQLVMALAHRPPVLLLDEPTDGLDPATRDETLGILAEHLAEIPTTVLVATHHVAEVETLADHVGVLRGGRLELQQPVDALRRDLLRYRFVVPDGWAGEAALNGGVLRRAGSGRDQLWTVMGDRAEVVQRLSASGAAVEDVSPLTLEDSVLTLLTRTE
jgi:ABC-2 type transport system ATP-binding protein